MLVGQGIAGVGLLAVAALSNQLPGIVPAAGFHFIIHRIQEISPSNPPETAPSTLSASTNTSRTERPGTTTGTIVMQNCSPPGPKRLSWGRTTSQRASSRPGSSSTFSATSDGSAGGQQESSPCRDQQQEPQHQHSPPVEGQQVERSITCVEPAAHDTTHGSLASDVTQQSCKAILREVLSAVLEDSGPAALDHFQLTLPVRGDTGRIRQPLLHIHMSGRLCDPLHGLLPGSLCTQTVLAVLQHKLSELSEAPSSSHSKAAAAAAKQQVAAAQKEAETKAAKALQDAAEQVRAQHMVGACGWMPHPGPCSLSLGIVCWCCLPCRLPQQAPSTDRW